MADQTTNLRDGKSPESARGAPQQPSQDLGARQAKEPGNGFAPQSSQDTLLKTGNLSDFTSMHKDSAAAAIQSGEAFSKRLEEVGQSVMTAIHESIEANIAAAKAMLDVKTVHELFAVQSDWIRGAMERASAEAMKLSHWSLQTAGKLAESAQERYKKAANTAADKTQ